MEQAGGIPMFEALDKALRDLDPHEQQRFDHLAEMSAEQCELAYRQDDRFIWKSAIPVGEKGSRFEATMLKEEVVITRNKRFIRCEAHRHNYIEMQYCYSGCLRNVIEGKIVEVHAGELLLMATSVVHELLPAGRMNTYS